jgi:hypothetical protein
MLTKPFTLEKLILYILIKLSWEIIVKIIIVVKERKKEKIQNLKI